MSSKSWLFIGFCIIASVHKIAARSQVNVSNENKGQGGKSDNESYDDYVYDDENNSDSPNNEVHLNSVDEGGQAYLEQGNYVKTARPGENVTLECNVINPDSSTIVFWYNGTIFLTQAHITLVSDKRVSINANYTLTISNVQPEDDGFYKCRLLPVNAELIATLKIFSPPKAVRIFHGTQDVSQQTLEINQKENKKLQLNCASEGGYPTPAISWSSDGVRLDGNNDKPDIKVTKGSLFIENIKRHHSGIYQCLADNGIDTPIHNSVNVIVKHHPVITRHEEFVNTGEEYDAEIDCSYDSYPPVKHIVWSRGEEKETIRDNDKFKIINDIHNHHNRTRLSIKNVNKNDLTVYFCKVENELGHQIAKTILGLAPAPAHLTHYEYLGGRMLTTWTIKSVQPLTELQILYKTNTTGWRGVTAEITEQNNIHEGIWNVKSSVELPDGEWIISARARNTEGWAHSESTYHTIRIPNTSEQNATQAPANYNSATTFTIGLTTLNLLSLAIISLF